MLKICLVFWKSEPKYAYKRYVHEKTCMLCGHYVLDYSGLRITATRQVTSPTLKTW